MPLIRQGGAITVRGSSDEPEVLLVRAKKDPRQWIFPKGHQEKGETLAETAVRELGEEAGVIGKAVGPVGVSTFRSGDEDVEVTYFLVRDTGGRAEAERETLWRTFPAARSLLTFADAPRLLDAAYRMLGESA